MFNWSSKCVDELFSLKSQKTIVVFQLVTTTVSTYNLNFLIFFFYSFWKCVFSFVGDFQRYGIMNKQNIHGRPTTIVRIRKSNYGTRCICVRTVVGSSRGINKNKNKKKLSTFFCKINLAYLLARYLRLK